MTLLRTGVLSYDIRQDLEPSRFLAIKGIVDSLDVRERREPDGTSPLYRS